jgi:hypothetical protein
MAYRNGYIEFDAKISYTDGIIMPLWLMSNPDGGLIIPKEQLGAAWIVEFDIFETFSNGDTWDVSIHKYYKPTSYNHNGKFITNGIVNTSVDENGNPVQLTTFNGEVVYHNVPGEAKPRVDKFRSRILEWGAWGFITSWRPAYNDPNNPYYNPQDNEKQKYKFTGEELEKPVTFSEKTFEGFIPPGYSTPSPTGITLAGTTVSKYAKTYTHDTKEYRIAKMLDECEDHLVMDSVVYHYLFIERHTMVDNVAKNTFWSTEDG